MKRALAIVFSLLLLSATLVFADDFMPPDFRGDPLTVMAEWDFLADPGPGDIGTDNISWVGDGFHDYLGSWTHTHDMYDNLDWMVDPDDPQDGVIWAGPEGGQLGFFLANWTDDYMFKHLWIQITFGGEGVPFVSGVVGPNAETNDWTDPTYGSQVDPPFTFDPFHIVEYWILLPNPDREYVYIDLPPNTYVDQVVIDTISTNDVIDIDESTWGDVKELFR